MKLKKNIKSIIRDSLKMDYNKKTKKILKRLIKKKRINKNDKDILICICSFYFNIEDDENFTFLDLKNVNF